jgi:hypothetical protein
MKHKIHIPTFLAASFCLILGLWLQIGHPSAEDWVFSIIFLAIGFGLFATTIFRIFRKGDDANKTS